MNAYPSIIDVLFNAMAQEEGWFDKGTAPNRPQRNNNPLNLDFAKQDGAVLETAGPNEIARFARWMTAGQGIAGAYRQIAAWLERGMSLRQLITTQAPANENDTNTYLENVLTRVKAIFPQINEDQPLSALF